MLNLDEIQSLMINHGFEIVFPEILTFANQVKLFSQAEIIISTAVAGLANLMFCPENCKAVLLINERSPTNYYLFSHFAQILDNDLQFLPSIDNTTNIDGILQNDYIVNKDLLSDAIFSICNSL